jgi:AsmA family
VNLPRSRFLWSWRGGFLLATVLVALFLFRPGVYRLRNRIAISIGHALGRRVALDNVRLRVLPRPGFELEGLVIYDDPAFSAEPMISAQEVAAAIRFRSLLRGRLEIATLSATEPSVNLVRNDQGQWNLARLLERNAQIPAAPTGKSPSERRPAFPYLEATNARVNFKLGQTKKSYALMNADMALWQDSENSWGARIKAEPVRTDFHLTDTGLLQINATWRRSMTLSSTPLQVDLHWRKGQLGQITTLLSGKDRGWRGGVDFQASLSGTPEALVIESQTVVDDFHRYDIVDRENIRLATICSGKYSVVTSTLADLLCEAPVSDGTLRLRGDLTGVAQHPAYDLTVEAEKVPVASVVRLLRQMKKQIPSDLTATGLLNARFRTTHEGVGNGLLVEHGHRFRSAPQDSLQTWTGDGTATNVRLLSTSERSEIVVGTVPFVLTSSRPSSRVLSPDSRHNGEDISNSQEKWTLNNEQEPAAPHLRIGPVGLAIGSSSPVNAGGWLSTSGYRLFLRGDMELKDLFRLEETIGLPFTRPAAEGAARLDMSVFGTWQGFAPAGTTGTAHLRNIRAETRSLNAPIEITAATMILVPDAVVLQKISARTGNTHWTGSVTAPRHCTGSGSPDASATTGTDTNCIFLFDITADQLSTGVLNDWFAPPPAKRPWYRQLSADADTPASTTSLLAMRAHGSLHVGRFELNNLVATQISTQMEVDRGKIRLTSLNGRLLQGTHRGNWMIDVSAHHGASKDSNGKQEDSGSASTGRNVTFHGVGSLHDISMAQLGTLMNDSWITGTAEGTFDLTGSASSVHELLSRSDGKLQFVMRNGSLPHVEIPGLPGVLAAHRFAGELALKKGMWELSNGTLESRDGLYEVSGTTSAGRDCDFVLKLNDEQSWALTGTLAEPHVEAINRSGMSHAEAKRVADADNNKP